MFDSALYVPMFVVTEFFHGFHETIWGTTTSVKIRVYVNSYFNKPLLRPSGWEGLRRDNKRLVIMEKSCPYSFNVL